MLQRLGQKDTWVCMRRPVSCVVVPCARCVSRLMRGRALMRLGSNVRQGSGVAKAGLVHGARPG